ncbi:hypothetical protein RvY_15374 [Ramazzottius varieornatus]|uniref:Major facilitator superfamily (MFS) profile domain-containing protein n=1 Tax=Ramazzottius varieornatus TaxID=947166 RepID=A0A1D1VWB2_RAMVA|nr:hypothetical protein RvY_15374 [Ramazzottius varieornatus]
MARRTNGTAIRNRAEDESEEDVDSGWAWVVLAASFVANAITLGTNFAFSVFYAEWIDYFGKGPTATSMLLSMSAALVLAAGAPASILANRFGARAVIMVGGLLSAAGFGASAFVNSFELLFLTYGLMTGLGNGLAYAPSFGVLPLYFRKRRNFATSIVTAGNGVGIVLFSVLFRHLITTYTWRGAMLINGGIALNLIPCGAAIFKRQPRSATSGAAQFAELSLFKEASYYISMAHFLFMGSQYIFVVYCLKYAQDELHITKEKAAMIVSIMGAANIVGRSLVAFLSVSPKLASTQNRFFFLHFMSLCVAVTIACYPLCHTYITACVMAGLVGLSWGTKFSLTPGLQMDVSSAKRFQAAWGYLVLILGISFFGFPPIAGEIAKLTGTFASAFYFSGLMSLVAFCFCPLLHFLWWKKYSANAQETKRDHILLGPS